MNLQVFDYTLAAEGIFRPRVPGANECQFHAAPVVAPISCSFGWFKRNLEETR